MERRNFLKMFGSGAAVTAAVLAGCKPKTGADESGSASSDVPKDKMTYRSSIKGDKVSILGYGCMRLPTKTNESARDSGAEIDQDMVNKLTDYAIEHGVTYFDTSPAYCKGKSEEAMGIALSRHKRSEYLIATKLSNFDPATWNRKSSIEMYHNSLKYLKVDYLDYMLLHGIGMGGMSSFIGRYVDNGILDFLLKEREAGRIRHLGFSYHGDVEVFDYLLSKHDEYKWDFVQIQLNYVDWKHAKEVNERNTNAEYLYNELAKRSIPVVVMEPLLGGRLASVNAASAIKLQELEPQKSIASWAFRFAGSHPAIMTVLSGMTYMEHLQDNLRTYSPLKELTEEEKNVLEQVAQSILKLPSVPCTSCKYCMPCPYGLDIPEIFSHYNKCLNEGNTPTDTQDSNYAKQRRAFLVGYDRSVPRLRQANHCIGCNQCTPHCPQRINIPQQMQRIDGYVEELKKNPKP